MGCQRIINAMDPDRGDARAALPPRLSRESATIFGKGTIPEPSVSHIGQGVALVAQGVAFVYI
jgi:hypothetical protein